jgi:hypothetical protein
MMQSGEALRGAGRTIYLLRDTDDFHTRYAGICAHLDARYQRYKRVTKPIEDSLSKLIEGGASGDEWEALWRRDSAAMDSISAEFRSGKSAIRTMIVGAVFRETGTGMSAHYTFTDIPAGKYVLFGEWTIGKRNYQWWLPVEVRAGDRLQKDLDNAALAAVGQVTCGIP